MSAPPPYGGRRLIADTSAWTAIERARKLGNVPPEWGAAIERDQILTHPVVMMELLHSTRNHAEFVDARAELEALQKVELTATACAAAISALDELAEAQPEYHRVDLGDLLVAASAADTNAADGVLHYNHRDFGKLAQVFGFHDQPLGPPGAFERPQKSRWERLVRVLRRLPTLRGYA